MKLIFLRNVDCDYFSRRLDEAYPKYFYRNDILNDVTDIERDGKFFHLALENGDTLSFVPQDAVEKL